METTYGPVADVYAASAVSYRWHLEGVGVITYRSTTYLGGLVTFGGDQGYRSFRLDALVEATPPADPERRSSWPSDRWQGEVDQLTAPPPGPRSLLDDISGLLAGNPWRTDEDSYLDDLAFARAEAFASGSYR